MRVILKVVLTIVAFFIAAFFIGIIKDSSGSQSSGVLGLVIGAGLLAGVVAIWKYNPDKNENSNISDNHQLDKN